MSPRPAVPGVVRACAVAVLLLPGAVRAQTATASAFVGGGPVGVDRELGVSLALGSRLWWDHLMAQGALDLAMVPAEGPDLAFVSGSVRCRTATHMEQDLFDCFNVAVSLVTDAAWVFGSGDGPRAFAGIGYRIGPGADTPAGIVGVMMAMKSGRPWYLRGLVGRRLVQLHFAISVL